MRARLGDRLILQPTHPDSPRRVGIIIELHHDDGSPPYTVRWLDDEHEALVYPGPDGRIEPSHR
ncbi:DUF1918 domain-containing protein [Luedemannella flava]|uniref:DUF1918 domain-containing protein n=1 Tax=Luedemannella flava TaxID=349316 RepID=UPI0031DE69DE